jgi:D-alanyl-D-alanine carboxypeptidase
LSQVSQKQITQLWIKLEMISTLSKSLVAACLISGALSAAPAQAAPSLVADLATGEVIMQEEATRAWYPASLTKLMTAYVALHAVREGRVSLDTPFVMSMRAARAAPSKMGFNQCYTDQKEKLDKLSIKNK